MTGVSLLQKTISTRNHYYNDIRYLVASSVVCPGISWILYYEIFKANRPDSFPASVSEALGKGSGRRD